MLDELITSPGYRAFVNYLLLPETLLAVLLPGLLSLGILGFYERMGFTAVGSAPFYFGDQIGDDHIMSCPV